MATLLELASAGELVRYDAELEYDQQELRRVFALPRACDWIAGTLPSLGSAWNIQESPIEQLDALLALFCAGEPLAVGHKFKSLNALGEGIWELKTADIRMFGWFATKDCFVVTDCDLKRHIVERNMYGPYCEQAVRFRDRIDLDEPKFIPGEDPLDVVSDFYFP